MGGRNYYGPARPGRPPRLANAELPGQFEQYFVDERVRAIVDPLKFDFDREPATFGRSRRIYDALSFDLRAAKNRGGKILLWHGWADGAIGATPSIGYYEGVVKFMGGRKATEDFFRLFLIPGVHHGGGGPGFTELDAFAALENWIEKGLAPDELIASRISNGTMECSRPVYPYPVQLFADGRSPAASELWETRSIGKIATWLSCRARDSATTLNRPRSVWIGNTERTALGLESPPPGE